jgi:hypothetical protein
MEPTFELLLTLIHPSKRIRTASKKTKNLKPETENKGPYDVSISIGWDPFLAVIAEKLLVVPSTLVVASFEWHWLKPTSGPWLPVQNESGLASMLKKVKQKPEAYVIIRMHAPTQRTATESSSKAWDITDEHDSDLEDNLVTKKVCIPSRLRIIGTQFLVDETGRRARGDRHKTFQQVRSGTM